MPVKAIAGTFEDRTKQVYLLKKRDMPEFPDFPVLRGGHGITLECPCNLSICLFFMVNGFLYTGI